MKAFFFRLLGINLVMNVSKTSAQVIGGASVGLVSKRFVTTVWMAYPADRL